MDLTDLDAQVSAEALEAIETAAKDFPGFHMTYFGSIAHQIGGFKEELAKLYARTVYQAGNGKISKEDADTIGRYNADQFVKTHGLDQWKNCFGWSLLVPAAVLPGSAGEASGGPLRYCGVGLNEDFGGNYTKFMTTGERNVASGFHPIGCGSPKATVDHEIGHEIDRLIGAKNDPIINGLYHEMKQNGDAGSTLSVYAEENVMEFIAEAYSEYRNNPQPRRYARAVYLRLKVLWEQRGGGAQ